MSSMKSSSPNAYGTGNLVAYSLQNETRFQILNRMNILEEDLRALQMDLSETGNLDVDNVIKTQVDLSVFVRNIRPKIKYAAKKEFDDFLKFEFFYHWPVFSYLVGIKQKGTAEIKVRQGYFDLIQLCAWIDLARSFVEENGITRFERPVVSKEIAMAEM